MNTRYNPGDVVNVRSDLKKYTESYPMDGYELGFIANESMILFRGKPVTIVSCEYSQANRRGRSNYSYTIKEDEGAWAWTDAMFEDLAIEDISAEEDLDALYDWI